MPDPALIGPPPASTPTGHALTQGRKRALPDDVLRDASRRLGIMSLVAAVLWILGTLLGHLATRAMMPGDPRWRALDPTDVIAGVSVVLSLALFAYTRRSRRDPQTILDLGLVYMVMNGLALGLMFHWNGAPPGWQIHPEISWIGVVVLMFAAIVPNVPRKVLVAGLVAVSMNPLGMLFAKEHSGWNGPASDALLMHYPDYLLVGVAVVIAHVVTKLGQQVAKAREMGSYRLGELLGRGGMGEVYKASHRMLARAAAIKLIRPEMLTGRDDSSAQLAVTRFRREAEAAANLRSPHTVELYDFGVTEDDTIYFVMELLDGMNLETLVRRHGPLPAGRVVHILCQVCESLEEAHARGLVHRDIKPPNIHVGTVGLRHDFVKVLDFGLVKAVVDKYDEHSMGTAQGMTPGTPSYMAPEMALGEKVDGRADIYALGCVAYFLLTGQLVFDADNMLAMIAKHLQATPEPPSRRTATHIPAALDQLVMRCLEKNPADRPQSAAVLARALSAIEVPRWDEEQAARWWSANPPMPSTATLPPAGSRDARPLMTG